MCLLQLHRVLQGLKGVKVVIELSNDVANAQRKFTELPPYVCPRSHQHAPLVLSPRVVSQWECFSRSLRAC